MNDHFIKYIEIKDFKCFDDFKADGLAQVNLIGGKNNVGKTAFMEACFINSHAQDIKSFTEALRAIKLMRENLNILFDSSSYNKKSFIEKSNCYFSKSNINTAYFKIKEYEGVKKYLFEYQNKTIETKLNDFSFELDTIENIGFIDNFGFSNDEIIRNYSFVQKKDEEQTLNTILNELDARIESFKVINDKPQCKTNGIYRELTELGDGVRHIVSIVATLYASEKGYLFIDEIDNGIHYSMLDKVWKIILTLSKELNVQVFATTHSKECIESYGRVAKILEYKNINYMTLVKNKSNEVVAATYDYDLFLSTLDQDHEVRGW